MNCWLFHLAPCLPAFRSGSRAGGTRVTPLPLHSLEFPKVLDIAATPPEDAQDFVLDDYDYQRFLDQDLNEFLELVDVDQLALLLGDDDLH